MSHRAPALVRRAPLYPVFSCLVASALLAPATAKGAEVAVRSEAELRSAMESATPGTTIVLAPGRYTLTSPLHVARSGRRKAPITVRSAQPRRAVIETNGQESAFRVTAPYWRFVDLFIHVSGSSTYGLKLEGNGHSATISGNVIELEAGAEAGIKGAGQPFPPQPDNVLIEGNEIYFTEPTTYAFAEGIDAVAVKDWRIRKNVIHGIRTAEGGVAYGAMTKGNSINTLMEDNLFYDCFIALSFGGGGSAARWVREQDTSYEHRGGIMRNNIVLNSDDVAVYLYSVLDAKVYNNTLIGTFQTCGAGCSAIDVRMPGTADIRNNIIDKPIHNREGGSHTDSSNMLLPRPGDTSWFVNVARRDLRLKPGSAPVDRGETLTEVTSDFFGQSRPSGGAYDIGAAEVASAP